ncbi:MAG: hypothetical protein WC194_09870 [Mesotoga sp.]|uniref:hypothetical protein n=1 Tax=Mesotoga sp. TaxID=2053577 RepID=UPI003568FB6B
MAYNPSPETKKILDEAMATLQSVPYEVTARWLFYRLVQGGFFPNKKSYKSKFLPMLSKARKNFYGGWTPETLADDTRQALKRGGGYRDETDFSESIIDDAVCILNKHQHQKNYCELWFEAKAMKSQFEYYTSHITLRPFGGDPSINYKWEIAKDLEWAASYYGLPVVILYFGDLDPKGLTIPENAIKDIRKWCTADFDFYRAGLNPGDEHRYNIQENPDRPGTFQWEALDDSTAKELITRTIKKFLDVDLFKKTVEEQKLITHRVQAKLTAALL